MLRKCWEDVKENVEKMLKHAEKCWENMGLIGL